MKLNWYTDEIERLTIIPTMISKIGTYSHKSEKFEKKKWNSKGQLHKSNENGSCTVSFQNWS